MTSDPTNTSNNPLIASHTDDPSMSSGNAAYVSPDFAEDSVLKPPADPSMADVEVKNPAVDMIRQKLAAIYGEDVEEDPRKEAAKKAVEQDKEPDTKAEITEVQHITAAHEHRSKHQQYMYELSSSGKSLAEIQTAWHQYYASLSDNQKRDVWQEFYDNSAKTKQQAKQQATQHAAHQPAATALHSASQTSLPTVEYEYGAQLTDEAQTQSYNPLLPRNSPSMAHDDRSPSAIRDQVRGKINSRSALKVKHHLQSLLFGLGFGGLVLVIVLFSFFNEVLIAPFIQPSRKVSATPIILGTDGIAASDKNEVIIPKINLEIPLDFSAQTINENEIESGLENGVVHYPTTALPGQKGNASFFGHSSNNIFNPGKYKFAFVLLHELVPGDTFTIAYKGVAYTYQVYDKKVVEPSDVSVLNPVQGKASTAVLITCDPPGTSLRRLVVWGEQVSPNPSVNTDAAPTPTTSGAQQSLPGNGPTLWRRLINAVTGH